jgi:hypothetical protein
MSKNKAKGKKAEKISKRKTIKSAFDDKFGGDPIRQIDNLFGSIRKPVKKNKGGATDNKNKIDNRIVDTFTKKDDLGVSPAEKRDMKKKQNLGRGTNKMSAKGKIKGEMDKNLKRLEEIKKNQEAEDAAKKKKAIGKGPRIGTLTGRRAKNFVRGDITKKMKMGGVMKARGGTFKGTF